MSNKYPQHKTSDSSTSLGAVRRGKVNGSNHNIRNAKRAVRRQEAEARKAEFDKLTVAQKLASLGKTGSNRQRARYTAILAAQGNTPVVPKVAEVKSPKTPKKTKANKS